MIHFGESGAVCTIFLLDPARSDFSSKIALARALWYLRSEVSASKRVLAADCGTTRIYFLLGRLTTVIAAKVQCSDGSKVTVCVSAQLNLTFLSETDNAGAPSSEDPSIGADCTCNFMQTLSGLGVGLRPRPGEDWRGVPGAEGAPLLLGSWWRKVQAFPLEHDPAPLLKNLQSETCFQVQESPLRQVPFIQKRQGFPLPSPPPLKVDGAGLSARMTLPWRGVEAPEAPGEGRASCE